MLIKKIFAISIISVLILNILAFATQRINMLAFWIVLFVLYGITHLFVKFFGEKDKKSKRRR